MTSPEQRGYAAAAQTLATDVTSPAPTDPNAALLAASESGDADAAALAIRAGADLETRDADMRRTPLMHAVLNDHVALARLLDAMGADPGIRDANGRSALDHARESGFDEIALILGG